jgi:hypothetical protein
MHTQLVGRRRPALVALTLAAALSAAASGAEPVGLTTKSPEVLRAIDRGIKFLESDAARDDRVGAQALIGLALLTNGAKPDHARVEQAVARIQKALVSRDVTKANPELDIYSTGLSILFLVKLDKHRVGAHRGEIEHLLQYLRARQKRHGGWGYPERDTGDTSMTQYGVLSLWAARQAGFDVPQESIDAVTGWLLRTQDPSGGFGYQGTVAESPLNLVSQQEVKHSMTAAGLGSLYICGKMLRFVDGPEKPPKEKEVPSALKEVKPKQPRPDPSKHKSKIDPRLVREAEAQGEGWFAQNFQVQVGNYNLYYLYALERYKSFAESGDKNKEEAPQWYGDGARFLIAGQSAAGTWNSGCGDVPDTAFGVLFLLRSTGKVLSELRTFDGGTMSGNRGFDPNGRPLVPGGDKGPQTELARKLLQAIDDLDDDEIDKVLKGLEKLPNDQIEALPTKQAEAIRRLVSHRKWENRLEAVRLLGKVRKLDNVPVLIYALSDPVVEVARAANEALLRISRSPSLVRFPENPGDAERRGVIEKWKAWYQTVRPGAEGER